MNLGPYLELVTLASAVLALAINGVFLWRKVRGNCRELSLMRRELRAMHDQADQLREKTQTECDDLREQVQSLRGRRFVPAINAVPDIPESSAMQRKVDLWRKFQP